MGPLKAYEIVARYLDGNVAGECYAASEAIYHLAGGKAAGLVPCVVRMPDGGTHWFLRWGATVLDATARQYTHPVRCFACRHTLEDHERLGWSCDCQCPTHAVTIPYDRARGCGFLTRNPSRRAAAIILGARMPLQDCRSGKNAPLGPEEPPAK